MCKNRSSLRRDRTLTLRRVPPLRISLPQVTCRCNYDSGITWRFLSSLSKLQSSYLLRNGLDRRRELEVRFGMRSRVALLDDELFGKAARGGGDESEVGGGGVEWSGAEFGVSLESGEEGVVWRQEAALAQRTITEGKE